ncbi:hypothetical protein BU23DRAFT_598727 [Bimuria novae-zelandiae CBS 107.79]|uniref:2EXR domain-containing protein n=1 Tax=Bimuria novae-zelandiae CBS 107.79 TaxID=1447943 RepID=A0A6A5VD09_9PLEO|nr:hypothetical protein BU23DRAFT_598727 [Bimuria novae-zelandiae CBS 107.79]
MADTSAPQLRASKRKRAQVNYYEEVLSEEEEEVNFSDPAEEEEVEERSPAKKRKTVSSKPLPKKKIFPFLQLPAELRNQIYSHCLHDPAGIYLFSTTQKFRRTVYRGTELAYCDGQPYSSSQTTNSNLDDDEEDGPRPEQPSNVVQPLVPALLAVCKQINAEAHEILYSHEFHTKDTLALHSFLVDIGPRAATYLKKVTLGEWGHGRGVHKAYNHSCFSALAAATNLEKFTFHGLLSWSKAPKPGATCFYRDAFPWLEAVGAAKGKADAALDLIDVMVYDDSVFFNRWGRRRTYAQRPVFKVYKDTEGFRKELGKLLNARMNRIRS